MKAFEINPDTHTISVHQDNMNPAEIQKLIRQLKGNLDVILQFPKDPIEVMTQSVRMIPADKEITFRLSWLTPSMVVSLDTHMLPEPNVPLTDVERDAYVALLWTMIDGANNG